MPFRVSCPSCGRPGRLPDHAIGRTIQCPACQHRYVFTASLGVPDGLELVDDDEPAPPTPPAPAAARPTLPSREPAPGASPKPRPKPQAASGSRPASKPVPRIDDDPYATDDDGYVEPPAWAVEAKAKARAKARTREASGGLAGDVGPSKGGLAGMEIPAKLLAGAGIVIAMILTGIKAYDLVTSPATPPSLAAAAPSFLTPPPAVASGPSPAPVSVSRPRATAAAAPAAARDGETEVGVAARAAAAGVGASDAGGDRPLSTADIVAESEPSVALIKGKGSSGTGFLVAPGLVATNAHVIDDEFVSDLEVRFVSSDDRHKSPIHPELLYEDHDRDIAFLAVRTDLKPLRVARSYRFRKGEDVTVIGSPGMGDGQVLENAISRGVMSTKTQIDGQSFYQLGIAINPGNSGGPVFDSAGRVIGIATLKSSKQEAMGFCIPVEDLHAALGKLAGQSSDQAEKVRSRHRVVNLVKGLGSGGAVLCLLIDVRRAAAGSGDDDVKQLQTKLEAAFGELDRDVFPTFAQQVPRLRDDALVHPSVRTKIAELSNNFEAIRGACAGRAGVDDDHLRPWKQTHRRLLNELSTSLGMEPPKELMIAFDDHVVQGPTTAMIPPPALGSFRSRMFERHGLALPGIPAPPMMTPPGIPQPPGFGGPPSFGPPGFSPPGFGPSGIPRPPSLRDRMSPRRGLR